MQRNLQVSRNSKRQLSKLQSWPVLWKQVERSCVMSQRDQKAQTVANAAGSLGHAVSLHPWYLPASVAHLPLTFVHYQLCFFKLSLFLKETPWQVKTAAKVKECRESGCCLQLLGRTAITQLSSVSEAERSMWIGASFDLSLPKLLPLQCVTYLPQAQDNCNN